MSARNLVVAAGVSVVLLAGCGSVARQTAPKSNLPGGKSTVAVHHPARPVLTPVCYIYNYRQPNLSALDAAQADNFNGPGQRKLLHANSKPPVYDVVLRNPGTTPITVNSITTALSNSSGQELTSDSESIGQTIAPKQFLQFTFTVPSPYVSSQTDDWGNPADYSTSATSCKVLTWD